MNHHEVKLNNQELESFYNDKIEKRYSIVKDNFQPLINLSMQFNILAGVENNQLTNIEKQWILLSIKSYLK